MSTILISIISGVVGFVLKGFVDFFISSNKDGLKDLKVFLTETIKFIEESSDQLEKDIFKYYTAVHLDDNQKRFDILNIQNNFKRLGVLVNKFNTVISEEIQYKSLFEKELMNFRSISTIDIHNQGLDGFNSLDKLIDIQAKYLEFKNKVFQLKSELSCYKVSEHSIFLFKKFIKKNEK